MKNTLDTGYKKETKAESRMSQNIFLDGELQLQRLHYFL